MKALQILPLVVKDKAHNPEDEEGNVVGEKAKGRCMDVDVGKELHKRRIMFMDKVADMDEVADIDEVADVVEVAVVVEAAKFFCASSMKEIAFGCFTLMTLTNTA